MEIGRLISAERISERLPSDEAKENARSRKKSTSDNGHREAPAAVKSGRVEEFSTPINFEYLPSGKILLNREAREQIIDFFE